MQPVYNDNKGFNLNDAMVATVDHPFISMFCHFLTICRLIFGWITAHMTVGDTIYYNQSHCLVPRPGRMSKTRNDASCCAAPVACLWLEPGRRNRESWLSFQRWVLPPPHHSASVTDRRERSRRLFCWGGARRDKTHKSASSLLRAEALTSV